MSTNNSVFNVLPLKNNKALLTSGKRWDELVDGQLGIFDSETNLSINGTTKVRRIHFIAGYDTNGDGTIDKIRRSPGIDIQVANIQSYTMRKYNPPKAQKFVISDFCSECSSTYSFSVQGWSDETFKFEGWNNLQKRYTVNTACCDTCVDCPDSDSKELTKLFFDEVNKDNMFTAKMLKDDGTELLDVDYAAYIADVANAAKKLDLELTSNIASVMSQACGIPIGHVWPRVKAFVLTLGAGFDCNGEVEETQELAYEQGALQDIRLCEYEAGAWRGTDDSYFQLYANGFGKPVEYLANAPKYDQIWLTDRHKAIDGWGFHEADLSLNIAIPSTDSATMTSVIGVLDKLIAPSGFDKLADDIASQDSATGTVIADIDDAKKDGIA